MRNNRIIGWIKRYFLAVAPAPFVIGCLLGMGLGMFGGWLLLEFKPALHTDATVVPLIVGLALSIGGINKLICRLFISYSRDPVFFLAVYEEKFRGEFIHRILRASGNPLWWAKFALLVEESIRRVPLADTARVHVVDRIPPGSIARIPLELRVLFQGGFDPQEVYERIVIAGYPGLDGLVRWRFSKVLDSSPGLEQKLRFMNDHPLAELKRELEDLSQRFPGAGLLSNIKKIDVKLTPEATISF